MKPSQHDISAALIKWISNQKVQDWRAVTFLYPRLSGRSSWERVIKQTMRELNNRFYRGARKRKNLHTGAKSLCRFLVMGGDRRSGTAYHVHGLIDGLGADDNYFSKLLNSIWKKNIKRFLRKKAKSEFVESEALVWHEKLKGSCDPYVKYMLRHEGNSCGTGIDKVLIAPTYLAGECPDVNIGAKVPPPNSLLDTYRAPN